MSRPVRPMIQCQLKLMLRPSQERQLRRWIWHLTAVYNWAIRKIEADASDHITLNFYDLMRILKGHSKKLGIPRHVIEGTVCDAHGAWSRCFRKLAGRPKLKGRRNRLNSVSFQNGILWKKHRRIGLLGLGSTRFHKQDIPAGHIGYARIVRRASGWYLCLFIQTERAPIARIAEGAIGIDPGFSHLLATSAGEIIEHPHELRAGARRLAQAQRGQRKRLTARLLERQARRRHDRNHKLSRQLVSENLFIAWSKDRTGNISRSFGKSVTSAGHQQLRAMINYKSRAGGSRFVEVPSRNSTRTCSACGARSGPTGYAGLKVRVWTCACGATHERDVNAAQNTLRLGLGISLNSDRKVASGIAS